MRLAYICTNYNNSAETIAAIDSLLANSAHEYRCIVIDNRSRGEDADLLRVYANRHPHAVDAIFNPDNVGYFAGLNVGLEHLKRTAPEFTHAVIGNNDLLFPGDFADTIEHCVGRLDAYPVVSPSVITTDGRHQNPHVTDGISVLRERIYDLYYSNYPTALLIKWIAKVTRPLTRRRDAERHVGGREIAAGHGSCYLLGPLFFRDFGQLWAPVFLFGEELFLAKQLAESGYRIYFEPTIVVTHASHATVGKLPSKRHWQLMRESHRIYRRELAARR